MINSRSNKFTMTKLEKEAHKAQHATNKPTIKFVPKYKSVYDVLLNRRDT